MASCLGLFCSEQRRLGLKCHSKCDVISAGGLLGGHWNVYHRGERLVFAIYIFDVC